MWKCSKKIKEKDEESSQKESKKDYKENTSYVSVSHVMAKDFGNS